MGKLNDALLEWMEYQREHSPNSSWAGAMEDYINHAVKLRNEYGEPEPTLPTNVPVAEGKDEEKIRPAERIPRRAT